MLDRPPLVVALMRHRGDDARLRIGPADPADAAASRRRERAPSAATTRSARIVRPSGRRAVIVSVSGTAGRDGACLQHHARGDGGVTQRREQAAALDHVGEGLALRHLALEGQEGRPHRVGEAAVGDDHLADRLGAGEHRVPHAEAFQHPPGRRRHRVGTQVPRRIRAAEGRIADRDPHGLAQGLAQGERQGQPRQASARDHDLPRRSPQPAHAVTLRHLVIARCSSVGHGS